MDGLSLKLVGRVRGFVISISTLNDGPLVVSGIHFE